jgi:nitrous oxidase accessory protein
MMIGDARFAGELVTAKGLVYTFDDIECLASFVLTGQVPEDEIQSLWVNDIRRPEHRLDARGARYWRDEWLRTPMSSGVVAVGAEGGGYSAAGAGRVRVGNWENLLERVRQAGVHRGHQPVGVMDTSRSTGTPDLLEAEVVVDPAGPVRTLSAALRRTRPHGRILVRAGTYKEPRIMIEKPVTIEGRGWPTFIGGEHEIITVTADSVAIRGLVVSQVTATAAEDRAGIRFSGVHGCTVENTRLHDTFFGIYLAQSSGCRIAGNTVLGKGTLQGLSGNAIHAWNSSDLTIEDNDIAGHRDGIYLEFTTGSRIRNNRSTDNLRYGLHFMFSHRCDYAENLFARNGAGVAVMFSDTVTMRRNRFEHNWGSSAYGLLLKELRDSRIEENYFGSNTVGLWTEGTSRVAVSGNRFVANGWAIRVLGDATENQFRGNLFLANSFDIGTNPGTNSNLFESNYWDRYRGYDLDRDGYGDIPFQPVRLFSVMIQEHEPALVLLHSFFIDLLDLAERVVPALTPETMKDRRPLMRAGA